jgi:hypothetical protein
MGAAMEPFRLRLKIGPHEFEAEGDQETVERQFALWRELVSSPAASTPTLPSPPPPATGATTPAPTPPVEPEGPVVPFDRLFRHDGEIVSLSALPNGARREADAALLLLLARKHYLAEELVTGGRLRQGLADSGIPVERVDRVWDDYMEIYVTRSGQNRAVRYRLTNPGRSKAVELARGLADMVA